MQIQKKTLETLFNATKGTEGVPSLTLAEARIRDSFIKPLAEVTDTYLKDRAKVLETFCLKKEDGSNDLITQKDGSLAYQFPTEKTEEINKELQTLGDEEVELNPPATIKEIIEKTAYSPKVGEVEIIDAFLAKL